MEELSFYFLFEYINQTLSPLYDGPQGAKYGNNENIVTCQEKPPDAFVSCVVLFFCDDLNFVLFKAQSLVLTY